MFDIGKCLDISFVTTCISYLLGPAGGISPKRTVLGFFGDNMTNTILFITVFRKMWVW